MYLLINHFLLELPFDHHGIFDSDLLAIRSHAIIHGFFSAYNILEPLHLDELLIGLFGLLFLLGPFGLGGGVGLGGGRRVAVDAFRDGPQVDGEERREFGQVLVGDARVWDEGLGGDREGQQGFLRGREVEGVAQTPDLRVFGQGF